ncbi:MAG TPA: GMP/IMP nucleotidase [Hyphomicrobiales bacterium]|nr:GMP/IMP nucleotidase [Hyphomicrobiales bacterium]
MVNWSEIDTVLLDMDGTLLDLHYDNYFWLQHLPQRYSELNGRPLGEVQHQLQTLSDSLQGNLLWYCLDHWSEQLQMDLLPLKQEVAHLIRFRADSERFLGFLRQQGKRAVLVTNAHPTIMTLKVEICGLQRYLDASYSSHPFGLAKENPGFWAQLRQAGQFDYTRCLFIDDSPSVLHCARREGLEHLLQVLQPDSSQPPREPGDFRGFNRFAELMPA